MNTPVAFFLFNRPDTTGRVFAEIAKARPRELLVVADGPRHSRAGEAEKCAAARAIVEQVDWPCQVLTNYAETNLGCKRRVSSGLDWVFATVEEAIILEDDCLPHPTFFRFCEELLEKYRYDERVMHITGGNYQFGRKRGEASYYFSRYAHVWGWASWRRAWRFYDVDMRAWTTAIDQSRFLEAFPTIEERRFWKKAWDAVSSGKIDTWDLQWVFACVSQRALAIIPNVNLISNLGFGSSATHTNQHTVVANLPLCGMAFPLWHQACFETDTEADEFTRRLFFSVPPLIPRVLTKARQLLAKCLPAKVDESFNRRHLRVSDSVPHTFSEIDSTDRQDGP